MSSTAVTEEASESPNAPQRGNWCVFESFAADGTRTVGCYPGPLDSSAGMVIEAGLTEDQARLVAARLAKSVIAESQS